MNSILYLDDEASNLNVFRTSFKYDYTIHLANNAKEAMDILSNESIEVVISDQRMPDMTGIEFLKIVKEKYPDAIRIILTAYTDVDVVINAFTECGIYRFITKPWDTVDVKLTLDNALEAYNLRKQNQDLVKRLESTNIRLEEKVQQRTKELIIANNVKSKIFQYMATELEKPIKNFSGFLNLIMSFEKELSFDKAKKYASEMSHSLLHTNMLLEKLFRWASLELKTSGFKPQKCILNNYINSNIEALRVTALKSKVALKNELRTSKVVIKADPSMLNFMINNVVLSAIRVGEANSDITIGADTQEDQGVISITGVSEELCQFMTHMTNELSVLEQTSNDHLHQDARLSFTLFSEYLKMMDGKMLVSPSDHSNQYTISFSYPIMD